MLQENEEKIKKNKKTEIPVMEPPFYFLEKG